MFKQEKTKQNKKLHSIMKRRLFHKLACAHVLTPPYYCVVSGSCCLWAKRLEKTTICFLNFQLQKKIMLFSYRKSCRGQYYESKISVTLVRAVNKVVGIRKQFIFPVTSENHYYAVPYCRRFLSRNTVKAAVRCSGCSHTLWFCG